MKIRMLDLFCGAGGAAMGYYRAFTAAGFDVEITGVDIVPQQNYPFAMRVADAMTWAVAGYDFVHASPPCQEYSSSRFLRDALHPDAPHRAKLLDDVYRLLRRTEASWIIENVDMAPMPDSVVLCGSMFGLGVRRHRRFASSQLLFAPCACRHQPAFVEVIGGKVRGCGTHRSEPFITASGRKQRREGICRKADGQAAMGIDWMTINEMCEAIPPAYTEWLGAQIAQVLLREKAKVAA